MTKKDLKLNKWIYRFLGKKSLRKVSKFNSISSNFYFNRMSIYEDIEERKLILKNL